MNEQALKDSYRLFQKNGYAESLEDFKNLIATNPDALKDSYRFSQKNGYKESLDDYKILIGVTPQLTTKYKFLPCIAKRGKPVTTKNGHVVIKYKVTVWDSPTIVVYQSNDGVSCRFMVVDGKYKLQKGTAKCTPTNKILYKLDVAQKDDTKIDGGGNTGGDGNVVVKTKKVYYDCSGVDIETTPLTYGCKDMKIVEIQGCLGIDPDGKFGPNTRKALIDNGYDISKGITKEIYTKVLASCDPSTSQTAGSTEGGADVKYLRTPIKMNFGDVPKMPSKMTMATSGSQGMTDAAYYQSLVDNGLIERNAIGRIVYKGKVLEPADKAKLDVQMNRLGYVESRIAATDEGARYVWKRE
jgi:hypothetical protein